METLSLRLLFIVLLITSSALCRANNIVQCFQAAANTYWLDPYLLLAIAQTESGLHPEAVNSNLSRNGLKTSQDYGLMQINSGWLPTLQQYGIDLATLVEPCTNIRVGAWILARLVQHHGRVWNAVGAYNAGCNKLDESRCRLIRNRYVGKVSRHYQRLRKLPLF